MALKVAKCDVWAVTIDDRPGGAAEKLENLSKAGANLEMVLARRTAENPGKGVMFVTPVKGKKVLEAAQQAGMGKPENIHSVRIEGGDKPGLGSKIAGAVQSWPGAPVCCHPKADREVADQIQSQCQPLQLIPPAGDQRLPAEGKGLLQSHGYRGAYLGQPAIQ